MALQNYHLVTFLMYYQRLIHLRKTEPLIYARHIRMFLKENSQILAYERFLAGQSAKLLVSMESHVKRSYQSNIKINELMLS